jgi:hypothetical protein
MKTTLTTLAIAVLTLLGATPEAEARHASGRVYISGYRSCGTPIYSERYLIGYDRCGHPVWGKRVIFYDRPAYRPACRPSYRPVVVAPRYHVAPCPPSYRPPVYCPPPIPRHGDCGTRITFHGSYGR